MNKKILAVTLGAILSAGSINAMAYEAGDFMVRAGVVSVQPKSDDFGIFAGGAPVDLGTGQLTASVDDNSQLGLNLVYFFTDQIALEVLAATPFSHDLKVGVPGVGELPLGETKHLPPTISALYYFNNPTSQFQPYVGAGVNYTFFFEDKFDSGMMGPDSPLDLSDLNLENSWGLSAQVGMDYIIDEHWAVNASVRYIDIDTKAKFKALGGAANGKVDVNIDPMVYMASFSYKF